MRERRGRVGLRGVLDLLSQTLEKRTKFLGFFWPLFSMKKPHRLKEIETGFLTILQRQVDGPEGFEKGLKNLKKALWEPFFVSFFTFCARGVKKGVMMLSFAPCTV